MNSQRKAGVPCLLISVGGTPNPVAYSIDHHQPSKIIFFASRESRAEIETKVRPLTSHRWADHEIITTPDHQDLMRSMETLIVELPRALADLGVAISDLLIDYTGGTKTMSVALVLGTIHHPVRYSYVGGTVRAKEGLGVVLDGTEALLISPNPWDILAVELRRRIARMFNEAHFAEAAQTADAAAKVGERWRAFFLALKDLAEAYGRWSRFDYAGALAKLNGGYHRLRQYVQAAALDAFFPFLEAVERDLGRLEQMLPAFRGLQAGAPTDPGDVRELILDITAQAERLTRLARRPDDGVARLYSALEKLAKSALAESGVDNSNASPEQIPEPLREEFRARYFDPATGTLRFGLHASYALLDALGHPLGRRYAARAAELRDVLAVRNNSLLVHGWCPVDEATFQRLLSITLDFLQLGVEELPKLPSLPEAA